MGECNLVNVATVVGKSRSFNLGSGGSASLLHNVSTGNETWLVKSLILGNVSSNGTDIKARVSVNITGTDHYILYDTWVPYGTSLVVLDELLPIYLQYQDYITVTGQEGAGLNAYYKYETLRE